MAIVVFHALVGGAVRLGPSLWIAAVVATVVEWLTAAFREPRAGGLQAPAAAEAMLREPPAQLRAGTPRAS